MTDTTATYEQCIEAARLSLGRGDRAGAEQALRTAIRMTERLEGGHAHLAAALVKLGELKREDGNSAAAEELFLRALEVAEHALGADDVGLVPALTSLGTLRIARGAPAEAEPLLTRALGISERRLGRDHPDLVGLLNHLSRLYLKQSAYAFAEPLLLRLYSIKRSKGDEHPEVATVLASLAAVKEALGSHEAAEQLWRRVLEIRERTLAPNHFAVATAIEHLAETCAARGKLDEAVRLFQRALAMRELTLGAGHASLRLARERIADLQLQTEEASFDPDSFGASSGDGSRGSSLSDFLGSLGADPVGLPRPVVPPSPPPQRPAPAPPPARPVDFRPPELPTPAVRTESAPLRAPEPVVETPKAVVASAPTGAVLRDAEPRVAEPRIVEPRAVEPKPVEFRTAEAPRPEMRSAIATAQAAPAAFGPLVPWTQESQSLMAPEVETDSLERDEAPPAAMSMVTVGSGVAQPYTLSSVLMPSSGPDDSFEDEFGFAAAEPSMRHRGVAAASALFQRRPVSVIAGGAAAVILLLAAVKTVSHAGGDSGTQRSLAQQQMAGALPADLTIGDSAAGLALSDDGLSVAQGDTADAGTASTQRSRGSAEPSTSNGRNARNSRREPEPTLATPAPVQQPAAPAFTAPPRVAEISLGAANATNARLDSALRAATSPTVVRETFAGGLTGGIGQASRSQLTEDTSAATGTYPARLVGSLPEMRYTAQLRDRGLKGSIVVQFVVDTAGRPEMNTFTVVQSDHDAFIGAVLEVIPSMRFVPARAKGAKIRSRVQVPFWFSDDR